MNHTIIYVCCLCIISSCAKPNCDVNAQSIVGEWKLIRQNVSDGGPSKWESVDNGTQFTLTEDGNYLGINLFSDCQMGSFESTETELILTETCNSNSGEFVYSLSWECGDIILSPQTVMCIEGCSYRYQKIA